MRQQGRVVEWHDARGYGFVVTHATEQRIFLHIKQFTSSRLRRPKTGDILTYQVMAGEREKLMATSVAFATAANAKSTKSLSASRRRNSHWGAAEWVALLLGLVLAWMAWAGRLPWWVAAAYPLLSLVTFLAYADDKHAATHGRWRTSESTLHLLALLGGWSGAWLAQKWLRHKSRKPDFQLTFWIVVVLNVAGLIWLSRQFAVG